MTFLLIELDESVKFLWKLALYLATSNRKIETEWHQHLKTNIYNTIRKHLSGYTENKNSP